MGLCLLLLIVSSRAHGQDAMKGPDERPHGVRVPVRHVETSSIKLALESLIAIYQSAVSPVGTRRCAFSPSCSAYAADALRKRNPVLAILMTADRLMRDHPGVIGEQNYRLLPNGRLYDPVSQNIRLPE